jgi:hypothetical protein
MSLFLFANKNSHLIPSALCLQLNGTDSVTINWEQCNDGIPDIFTIGSQQASGLNTITYSSELTRAVVILPSSPIQDRLTTYIRDCDADWYALCNEVIN